MTARLHLLGEVSSRHEGPALAAKGFRPFFLLAALFAASILPVWLLAYAGILQPGAYIDPIYWHAHEMIFGFAVAVIAGFLLTAVGNWTQKETLVGWPLLALAGLWVLGRLAITLSPLFPRWLPAVADLAFLPALAIVLARPLILTGNKRNFVMLALLGGLFATNLTVHLDVAGVLPGWRRQGAIVAVDLVVLMMTIIAGRVFPMFTRNATDDATIRSIPRLDVAAILAVAAVAVIDLVSPDGRAPGVACGIAGVLAALRAVHWGARRSFRIPLLWVLHVGYAWIPIGLGLRAAARWGLVPPAVALHALTAGAVATLTLGMMARVALGHTGRTLRVPATVTLSFALVTASALVRVAGPLLQIPYRSTVFVAGVLFSAAFLLYALSYAPILLAPRVDGKPG